MKKIAFTLSLALSQLASNAFAHDGHGLGGHHWHATDAWGLVGLAVVLVVWAGMFASFFTPGMRRANSATPPSSSIHFTVRPSMYQFQLGGVLSMDSAARLEA